MNILVKSDALGPESGQIRVEQEYQAIFARFLQPNGGDEFADDCLAYQLNQRLRRNPTDRQKASRGNIWGNNLQISGHCKLVLLFGFRAHPPFEVNHRSGTASMRRPEQSRQRNGPVIDLGLIDHIAEMTHERLGSMPSSRAISTGGTPYFVSVATKRHVLWRVRRAPGQSDCRGRVSVRSW